MKKIFYILTLFAALAFAGCSESSTLDDLTDGNYNWQTGGSGNGSSSDRTSIPANEIHYTTTYAETVKPYNVNFGEGVKIVSNAYENGKGIITFNKDVLAIGESAFYECEYLESIILPDGVISIGDNAFYGCRNLESITIPGSVTYIAYQAFYGCESLSAFYGKYASEDNRFLISDGVLLYFAPGGLTSYTIPYEVTKIGNYAFAYCSNLRSITIPDSVTEIWPFAFYECSSLESITIPDSVTEIGDVAFAYCSSLTNITIPDSVMYLGVSAFAYCRSLTNITIPDSVTYIGAAAFAGCSSLSAFYGKYASEDNRYLIVDGVLNSFAPAGVISYTIPDSVTEIGDVAFGGCTRLTSITIPNSVTTIGQGAFSDCNSLKSVYCRAINPPEIDYTTFQNNSNNRRFFVPKISTALYRAAKVWSSYADDIVGYY